MFTLNEHSEEFYSLNEESKSIVQEVLGELGIERSRSSVAENAQLVPIEHSLFVIDSGFVRAEKDSKIVMFLEPGELLGWGNHSVDMRFYADSKVSLWVVPRESFFEGVHSQPALRELWAHYVECQLRLYSNLIGVPVDPEGAPAPQRRYFRAGEPIIVQGTSPTEVYTMLYGTADAFVEEIKVGMVKTGEIFGAMAATMNTTRSASVIARSECSVAVIGKEHFLSLIKTRPRTVLQLIEDMSRIIVSQNEKLVAMSEKFC